MKWIAFALLLAFQDSGPIYDFALGGREASPSGLVVHEWGTFTAMAGWDGTILDGVAAESEELPGFVHRRSVDDILSYHQKMETPVLYFHTDREMCVSVRVDFPLGVLTQWYPRHRAVGPEAATGRLPILNGFIDWGVVRLLPDADPATLPAVDPGNHYIHARAVRAATVQVCGDFGDAEYERERFLFYRGLGRFSLPVCLHLGLDGRTILVRNEGHDRVGDILVYWKEGSRVRTNWIDALGDRESREFAVDGSWTETAPDAAADEMATRLERAGLYGDEARAMVNTWRRSYFGEDGLRIFYIMPQDWVDRLLPLTIQPVPDELRRVFVARVEALTLQREAEVERIVARLGAADYGTREGATAALSRLGRFAAPMLSRAAQASDDPEVRARAAALLDELAEPRR